MRAHGPHQQGVAVGRGLGHQVGAEIATGTRPVVNDGLLLGEAVIWSYKRLLLFLLEVVGGLL